MKKYYKILGLKSSASFEEVTNKYNELTKEFDPSNHADDLKEFFISEQKKIDDAYDKISLSNSNVDSKSSKKNDDNVDKNIEANNKVKDNNDIDNKSDLLANTTYSESVANESAFSAKPKHVFINNFLLVVIAVGVWGLFLQNMGLFVSSNDYTQKVRVVNTVDTEVKNSINVNGSVDVENIVDINIERINDQGNVFYKKDDRYFLLPTYDPYN